MVVIPVLWPGKCEVFDGNQWKGTDMAPIRRFTRQPFARLHPRQDTPIRHSMAL
jgi:hypothetical protein